MTENKSNAAHQTHFTLKERRTILFIGDFVAAGLALLIALLNWANEDSWLGLSFQFFEERPDPWFYLLPLLWLLLLIPLYDPLKTHSMQITVRYIGVLATILISAYLILFFVAPPKVLPRRSVLVFLVVVVFFTLIWRWIYARRIFTDKVIPRTIIVGAGKAGTRIAEIINLSKTKSYDVIGFIDDDPEKAGCEIEGYPVLGTATEFFDIVEQNEASQILMAISNHLEPDMFDALTMAEERGLQVTTMPVVYEELLGRVPIFLLNTDWMLRSFYDACHAGGFYEFFKRVIDIIGGLIGLIFLIILFPFVALFTLIDSGRPIFYTQERLGLHGVPFNIIKFRTMIRDAEKDGVARPASEHDSRITRFGGFLRKSHIDEMPQFINVLRGDISLVGPRAERAAIVKDLQREIPFYRGRLLVRPGITGWAQVNFGYASGAEENAVKLEYDLYYIKHRNLFMDISILFKTLKTIFGLKGR